MIMEGNSDTVSGVGLVEEGSEPPADTTAHAEALTLERAGLRENFE